MVNRESNIEPAKAARHGFRFSLRFLFIIVAIISLLMAGGVWLNNRLDEYFIGLVVGNPGPVEKSDDWPRALKEFVDEATKKKIDIEVVEVHCIQSGWDEDYMWRMKAEPILLEFIKEKYKIHNATSPEWSYFSPNNRSAITELQNLSWPLPELVNSDYFASPSFIAREPGDRFEMVYDRVNGFFVFHYYFDF